MSDDLERRLLDSWSANAAAWTAAVRWKRIPSRTAGTDAAILWTFEGLSDPAESGCDRVLDVGCGEGWLARELAAKGFLVVGVDGSAEMIGRAREAGESVRHRFMVRSYEEISRDPHELGSFQFVVCNFSLLGEEIDLLLSGLYQLLDPGGLIFIQTVHPFTACGDGPYQDGWRTETFDTFGDPFPEPMPWYFRSVGSWMNNLHYAGFMVIHVEEPVHPETYRPLSLIMTGWKP